VSKAWKAIGDYIILAKNDVKSKSGLILDAPYIVMSIGGFVPIDIECGVAVVLSGDAEPTYLEPSNPNSPCAVHYRNICATDGGDEPDYIEMHEEPLAIMEVEV
jgi:hypothetical protein